VIVTNYNYENYIGRCLRSLVSQTLPKSQFEIICVDDASTDDSRTIISAFGKDVKLIYLEKNLGLASAANIGLRSAVGRLIVRVDADDYVHPEFLHTLVLANEILGAEFDAFALDYLEVDELGRILHLRNSLEFPIACAIAFKMEVLMAVGAYRDGMRIFEEKDLLARFGSSGFKMKHIELPLYRYVKHSKSLTTGVFI
jgi:glycosyltransferase involved in cell wall biosynthesis